MMTKEELIKTVNQIKDAPSVCAPLKEACENYLKAVDTTEEAKRQEELFDSIKKNITLIDELIALCSSEQGKQIFGESKASQMLEAAKSHKANGGKYCFYPACSASEKIVEAYGLNK